MAEEKIKNEAEDQQIAHTVKEPKIVSYTEEELMQVERDIQLGKRDTLPDGTKISVVQAELLALEKKQEKERSILNEEAADPRSNEKVRMHNTAGVTSIVPTAAEEKHAAKVADNEEPPTGESDLPKKFPHREKLIAAGSTSWELVKSYIYDDYIGIGLNDEEAREAVQYSIDKADKT